MSCSSEDYSETKVIGLWHISSTEDYGETKVNGCPKKFQTFKI